MLKLGAGLFPKGCGGPPGVTPNGTGAGAGVEEPNAIGAAAPYCAGTAAGVEPNVVDCACGAVPKVIPFVGTGADPNPELGP